MRNRGTEPVQRRLHRNVTSLQFEKLKERSFERSRKFSWANEKEETETGRLVSLMCRPWFHFPAGFRLRGAVLVRRRVSPPRVFHIKITRLQPDAVCIMTYPRSNIYSLHIPISSRRFAFTQSPTVEIGRVSVRLFHFLFSIFFFSFSEDLSANREFCEMSDQMNFQYLFAHCWLIVLIKMFSSSLSVTLLLLIY